MKMQRSCLGAVALAALSSVASAQSQSQSQVRIFGIVDVALTNITNGSAGSQTVLANGQASTSRLGFRGTENLGGGWKAGFWLEGQVNVDDGTGGSTGFDFQRRSTISLIGPYGELRLGRDRVPTYLNWGAYDLWGYVGVATTANLRGKFTNQNSAGTTVRTSNTIAYWTPEFHGFSGHFMKSADEGTIANYTGGRITYKAGKLQASAAIGKTDQFGAMLGDMRTKNIGVSYDFGPAYVVAAYEKSEYSTRHRDLTTVGVRVPYGKGRFKVQWAEATGFETTTRFRGYDATLIGVGYDYSLSRRTRLYFNYGHIDNQGTTTTGANYVATGNGPDGILRGETSSGYQFGIRHSF